MRRWIRHGRHFWTGGRALRTRSEHALLACSPSVGTMELCLCATTACLEGSAIVAEGGPRDDTLEGPLPHRIAETGGGLGGGLFAFLTAASPG